MGNCLCQGWEDYRKFFYEIASSKGVLPILLISTLISFGVGCVVGVIPNTVSDRYARLNHNYTGDPCSSFDRVDKPDACQQGSDDAQFMSALSNVAISCEALIFNPMTGSMSDTYGRRHLIVLSCALACVPSLVFVLLQAIPTMNPFWYYASYCPSSIISYLSIIFAALSDSVPSNYRAASFGVLLACFYCGFAFGPTIPLFLDSLHVSIVSLLINASAFLVALRFLPETLSPQAPDAVEERTADNQVSVALTPNANGPLQQVFNILFSPIQKISILNQNCTIRLLAASSFVSGMVFASDASLLLYYIEDQLNVRANDLASMFLVLGVFGLIMQAGMLQPLVKLFGEKGLLVVSFAAGTLHNLLYGVARSKGTIYAALIVSQLTKLNTPILSTLVSREVDAHEQGRVQGALSAANSIAYAVGPLLLEFVYSVTKHRAAFGPGFMFVFAAFLYAMGTVLVSFVPTRVERDSGQTAQEQSNLEEPLIGPETASDEPESALV